MNDTEQMIKDKGADVAPRVTLDSITANVRSTHYFTAHNGIVGAKWAETGSAHEAAQQIDDFAVVSQQDQVQLQLLTICVLVLANGFTVVGQSACASPENYNQEIGRTLAYRDAFNKIGAFMGYELRTELHQVAQRSIYEQKRADHMSEQNAAAGSKFHDGAGI